jgi:peroxiredoxin|tara:strand:- start:1407 stop:2279 length:873 start_codon:yes stop_codon:yes gene_type:complete
MRALFAAILLSGTLLNAADKKPERTFNDAAKELITKVRALVSEDRAKAFNQYAKGAQELAKEFPKEVGPLMMMAEASGLVEDKKLSADLAVKAENGVLKILKKDPKNSGANAALMRIAGSAKPEKAKALLKQIAENGPPREAAAAKGQLTKMEALGKPVDISFKSLDGRVVDINKLKGKVVLIDFWATWCGPCVAELPNVKKTYAKFHEKGFEIIGISLDQSRDKLSKFVEKEKMPWPQHFDGQGWKNEYAVKYGIQGIPAMWLIDKKGNLVDMKARGGLDEKVEKFLAE